MKVLRVLILACALGLSAFLTGTASAVYCPDGAPACLPASACFQYCKAHRPSGYVLCAVGCDPYDCCWCDYRFDDPLCI